MTRYYVQLCSDTSVPVTSPRRYLSAKTALEQVVGEVYFVSADHQAEGIICFDTGNEDLVAQVCDTDGIVEIFDNWEPMIGTECTIGSVSFDPALAP